MLIMTVAYVERQLLFVAMTGRGFVRCDDLKKVFAVVAPRMPQHGIETAFR